MADLTKVLPEDSATVRAIYDYWKTRGGAEKKRGYLGASSIGKECERELWYSFRQCSAPSFEGRLYRLFNRGHREEHTFVEELKGIGCEVYEVNPQTGDQFEVALFGGHFQGHCDGVALGIPEAPKTWHLLEMKTSNTNGFKKVKKDGVEKAYPIHYAQMQIYMGEMGLTRALYIVVCKETDELYAERVRYDATFCQSIRDKAERIIFASTPPAKISDRADAFACKCCDARELCHGIGESAVPLPALSCRQCCHATPEQDGTWSCNQPGKEFGEPCERHLMLPSLVSFAHPTDSLTNKDGSHVIEFTAEDGTTFHHGQNTDSGQYNSHHLMTMPRGLITLPRGVDRKDGRQTQPELEARWSLTIEGIERVWSGPVDDLVSQWSQHIDFPMGIPVFEQETNDYKAADFGGACAIIFPKIGRAEIRKDTNQK